MTELRFGPGLTRCFQADNPLWHSLCQRFSAILIDIKKTFKLNGFGKLTGLARVPTPRALLTSVDKNKHLPDTPQRSTSNTQHSTLKGLECKIGFGAFWCRGVRHGRFRPADFRRGYPLLLFVIWIAGAPWWQHPPLACFDHVGQEETGPTADPCCLKYFNLLLTASLQKTGLIVA